MTLHVPTPQGRTVKIVPDNPASRASAIASAVAERAYRIFESRGFVPGHDREDWLLAESEIVHPLEYGLFEEAGRINLTTDASCFAPGEITVRVEPRRLTLCGTARSFKGEGTPDTASAHLGGQVIFRAIDLPAEVDSSGAKAKFNGCILEIWLPKVSAAQHVGTLSKAA